jgi:hypothetical protein
MLSARQHWLHSWNIDAQRGRHDYDCDEHTIEEMMHAGYFGAIHHCFRRGDYVYVTDAKQQLVTLLIEDVDAVNRQVRFSVLEKFESKIITADSDEKDTGLAIRWKGPRGGMFCIVDKDGNVLKSDLRNKVEAERAMIEMVGQREAA